MITLYRAFLVLLALVAGLMMPEALGLPKDSQYTIGPGFLPLIMLGAIIVCCAILLLLDLKDKTNASVKKESIPKMLLYILATALLIFCMEHVGIVLSVAVYIFSVIFFVERHPVFTAAKVSIITSALIYAIFHVWLKVPMTICNFF
ncbi:MAG: tripartite tricarboxylate transporter TctB family protein [Oscillibacter sp.]|nr:tripartite tricarboxylate transporter TctB family protein [Oscillibacter sp.]